MSDCLAVAADGANGLWRQVLLFEKAIDALRRKLDPMVFSNGAASYFVRPAAAQAQQFIAQYVWHGGVVGSEQFNARPQFYKCNVQTVEAGARHYPYIERHGLTLARSQESSFFLVHAGHQRLALLQEACALRLGNRVCHRQLLSQRVNVNAINLEFVVQVRASGQASRTDIANHLALFDGTALRWCCIQASSRTFPGPQSKPATGF